MGNFYGFQYGSEDVFASRCNTMAMFQQGYYTPVRIWLNAIFECQLDKVEAAMFPLWTIADHKTTSEIKARLREGKDLHTYL